MMFNLRLCVFQITQFTKAGAVLTTHEASVISSSNRLITSRKIAFGLLITQNSHIHRPETTILEPVHPSIC
jgi:hypothetical protein